MTHPFDRAIELHQTGPNRYAGQTSPAYENMVGPYGGITAAVLVRALMQHPDRLGDVTVLTVNYASGVAPGAYEIAVTPVRTNRSTQHWVLSLAQTDGRGASEIAITATAMTALRRDTWHMNDAPMPAVPPPDALPQTPVLGPMEWLNRYDMRFVRGHIPAAWDGSGDNSLSQLWVRDAEPRGLDFTSLAAMSDVFYPRVWLRRATRVPAGTVSMTIYFHASEAQLAENGNGYLLAQAQAQAFRHGFSDQSAQLWTQTGTLLVTTHQLVYYKT